MPFVKLSAGRYLVGTEIRYIQIKGRGVLVRTGGGYMYLSEYMLHYAKAECLKVDLMMQKQKKTFQEVVIGILEKKQGTQKAQKEFLRRCPQEINVQFRDLVSQMRELEPKIVKN